MKIYKLFIIAVFFTAMGASFTAAQDKTASSADFSGMNEFWKIVDLMEKDVAPSEEQWKELFKTRAYDYMVKVNLREPSFRKYFPLAFMPSKSSELKKELDAASERAMHYLPYYLEVKAKRAELIKFQSELESEDLLKNSLKRAAEYLPKGAIEKLPPPPVSFAIFESDAYGDPSSGIIIDLLFAMHVNLPEIIGHEAHHYYLHNIAKLKVPPKTENDYFLVHAIDQLRLEGMADLIDKSDILDENSGRDLTESQQRYRREYRRLYYQSPATFKQIDELISQIADNPATTKDNSKKVWDLLPYGAHPHGYLMSRTIADNLGKKILIKKMANPFEFIRLYNRAAKNKPGYYIFSKKTMNYLKKLEEQYFSKDN